MLCKSPVYRNKQEMSKDFDSIKAELTLLDKRTMRGLSDISVYQSLSEHLLPRHGQESGMRESQPQRCTTLTIVPLALSPKSSLYSTNLTLLSTIWAVFFSKLVIRDPRPDGC